jgi:hypothetical protein
MEHGTGEEAGDGGDRGSCATLPPSQEDQAVIRNEEVSIEISDEYKSHLERMNAMRHEFYGNFQSLVLKIMDNFEEVPRVYPGSDLVHTNGNEYRVMHLANAYSENERYPVMVVYSGQNGRVWCRPLSDWHRSMKPKSS